MIQTAKESVGSLLQLIKPIPYHPCIEIKY